MSVVEMTVRKATASDAREVAKLHVRAWQAAYRGLVPDELVEGPSVTDRERDWQTVLRAPADRALTLVAVDGEGRLQGFCTVATPGDHASAEIALTYVEPQSWRTGIGSALLEAALSELRERGRRDVTLWVFARNDRARAFYAKFGFEPDGAETEPEWSGGEPAVRLRARLE
jgi:GNAT superfamily N-acetyltransferase